MRAALLTLLAVASPLAAQDAATALRRAERTYGGITTLTAEFTQTLVNPMLGGPEESQGVLYLVPPDRFAMRFIHPEGDRIVADGTWLWAYAPSSVPDQVIRQPVPRSGTASPNLVSQFVDNPLERYTARYVGTDTIGGETVDVVHLTPRRDDLPFREAEIAVARSDGLLRRIAVREPSGQRRTFIFRRIRTNVPIPDAELRFDVPAGVRVVVP
ncbi:MAG: outer membrane lipoprotein chaperone LolA [Gemmatimonadales bacterium]|nr:outer membrane lipoprotein chaperone LolA [Gemmatimonadales bacterium]NIN12325.1 outer membrane lipoprotein chaperone LolA [Gemmatimonadales bacterium]NIN48863.1 outer membrane lipoprotein chaperone LolA [Gemmatimonadales bacterium]NIP06327.1 outer membrane lipoprotein chaperone LolA [Gemmatimonadales bacterium]NIR00699.1 outer membrane lipoprotein chaperone LolA [Gemmatimonadales bacterium]